MNHPLRTQYRYLSNTTITKRELERLAIDLMSTDWEIPAFEDKVNINLMELGWSFKWNSRKRSIGICDWEKMEISLSKEILKTNPDKSHEWEDTLRHEIAHAIDFSLRGFSDHGRVWQKIAKILLATPRACTETFVCAESKYLKVCPNCKKSVAIHKRTKKETACGECCQKYNNNRFSAEFILEIIVNDEYVY